MFSIYTSNSVVFYYLLFPVFLNNGADKAVENKLEI